MNINWVLSDNLVLDPMVTVDQLKELGSFWGSWRTWRSYQTDNVVCHAMSKAQELIHRKFHQHCNFYIPNSLYVDLDRPQGVRLYEGNFVHDIDNQEEIVSMHLAAGLCDIVLLLGFDFQKKPKNSDRLLEHRAHAYRELVYQVIKNNPTVQWVIIDHPGELREEMSLLENITLDSLSNILLQ
jgi:hypothetical protein